MPRAAQVRSFRSTQTAPNASTVRDLTAYGTGPNFATTAAFAAAGASGYRWNPHSSAAVVAAPPSVGTAPVAMGWRDPVAESASEPITYAQGTWTVRTRINKTAMTVNATVTVRVTVIVYRVTSTGAVPAGAVNNGEIGRVVYADRDLPNVNASVSITASFNTTTATALDAGDKLQAECYVQNIINAAPAPAVAGYTVAFVVDETLANTGGAITVIPSYITRFARAATEPAAPTTDTVARRSVTGRALVDSAPAVDILLRMASRFRAIADAAGAADAVARLSRTFRVSADSALAVDAVTRSSVHSRAVPDIATATDSVSRHSSYQRGVADSAPATDAVARRVVLPRPVTDSAPSVDSVTREAISQRSVSDSALAADSTNRVINYVRGVTDNIGPTGGGGPPTTITVEKAPPMVLVDGRPAIRIGGKLYTVA